MYNVDAEIQFMNAYNRSGRQQQSVALKSPRSLRRRLPGSPSSSPRRTKQTDIHDHFLPSANQHKSPVSDKI